jgi:quinol monooxygenase YgiN
MIGVALRMTVKPERVAGLLGTLRRLIPDARNEFGNRAYFFHRVPGTDNEFVFYERYADEAELLAAPLQRQVLELFEP